MSSEQWRVRRGKEGDEGGRKGGGGRVVWSEEERGGIVDGEEAWRVRKRRGEGGLQPEEI